MSSPNIFIFPLVWMRVQAGGSCRCLAANGCGRQFFISLTIMTLRAAIYAAKAPNSEHFGDVFLSQQHQRKVIVDVGDLFYKFKLF